LLRRPTIDQAGTRAGKQRKVIKSTGTHWRLE
jgi:hypothetical protein